MSTKPHILVVSGIKVTVVRKAIKNLHLGVYPPTGRVRVAAPLALSDKAVRLAVIGKLGWIKRQIARFQGQQRQSERDMVSGESHYFLGRRYRLRVIEYDGFNKVIFNKNTFLELYIRPRTNVKRREQILNDWYRKQLKILVPPLLEKWQHIIDVNVADWRVKKMKTKWGSYSKKFLRIWLNLELAKKPVQCIEYIIVHEMVHFLTPHHDEHFYIQMNQYVPQWKLYKAELNRAPLGHENWKY
jgi:predicted metal-dependent hydrolase